MVVLLGILTRKVNAGESGRGSHGDGFSDRCGFAATSPSTRPRSTRWGPASNAGGGVRGDRGAAAAASAAAASAKKSARRARAAAREGGAAGASALAADEDGPPIEKSERRKRRFAFGTALLPPGIDPGCSPRRLTRNSADRYSPRTSRTSSGACRWRCSRCASRRSRRGRSRARGRNRDIGPTRRRTASKSVWVRVPGPGASEDADAKGAVSFCSYHLFLYHAASRAAHVEGLTVCSQCRVPLDRRRFVKGSGRRSTPRCFSTRS